MAKDDNIILLMTGLLRTIQNDPRLWFQQTKVHDLFGISKSVEMLDKEEEKKQSEVDQLKRQFMVVDSEGIISNLMNIIDLKPQYFRLFTIK